MPWDIFHAMTVMIQDFPTPLARRINERMLEMGLSQSSLATKAGVGLTYVRDILKGKSRNPTAGHLNKIATALECDLSSLTGVGASTSNKSRSQAEYSLEEMALISLWRALSDDGRRAILDKIDSLIPANTSSSGSFRKDSV